MQQQNDFTHFLDGATTEQRAHEAMDTRGWAENIAGGYTTPELAVEGWINSPGHFENILGPYTHMGVGRSDTEFFWTQNFAVPADPNEPCMNI